jgi:hypothetical protein
LDAKGTLDSGFIPTATKAEIVAGAVTNDFITPKGLKDGTLDAPSGTPNNDVGYLVRLPSSGKIANGFLDGIATGPAASSNSGKPILLDATGKVDAALLPVLGTTLRSAHNFIAGVLPAPAPAKGDIYFNNTAGQVDATYTGISGQAIKSGDMVMYDGTNYHLIPIEQDLTAYVSKAGNSAMANDAVLTWTAPGTATTLLNGTDATKSQIAKFSLIDCIVDCGTY